MRKSSSSPEDELKGCEVIEKKLGNIVLIVVKAKKGYISSSYLDIKTAEKVGDVAAVVRNAKSLNGFLRGKLDSVTMWAEDLGLRPGMSVKRAIKILKGEEKVF